MSYSRSTSTSTSSLASIAAPLELSQHKLLHWAVSDKASSKRTHDYKHIKTLGSGAFGTTHLVRNLVDQVSCINYEYFCLSINMFLISLSDTDQQRLYALKCIRGVSKKILR